jgi:hypothetical protein
MAAGAARAARVRAGLAGSLNSRLGLHVRVHFHLHLLKPVQNVERDLLGDVEIHPFVVLTGLALTVSVSLFTLARMKCPGFIFLALEISLVMSVLSP